MASTPLPESPPTLFDQLQRVAAESAASVTSAGTDAEFDAAMDEALRRLGELFVVDRAYLFRYSADLARATNTHEWCAQGISPERDRFQDVAADAWPWWQERMLERRPLQIPDVSTLPPEAADVRELLEAQGVRSLLAVPALSAHGQLRGFLGLDAVRATRSWSTQEVDLMRLLANTLGGALAQREAAEAARQALGRLEEIAAHVPGALYQFRLRPDGTFHFPYASAGIRDIYGVSPQEVVDDIEPVMAALHPDDLEHVREAVAESARTLEPWHQTYRVVLPGKGTRWMEGHSTPQPLDDGSILWHGYIRDVTDERAAQDRLRLADAAVRAALRGVVIIDRDGVIVSVNDAYTRMTGYAAADVVGRSVRDLASGAQDEDFHRDVWQTALAGRVWSGEVLNQRKDGTTYLEAMTITAVALEGDDITHFVAVKEDITERRQAEEERERLRSELGQAQKIESLGRLAGGVAHDFNNMLGVILGHAELALEELDASHPVAADIEAIRSAAERSAGLTRQLLAFARKQTVAPRALDLNESVGSMLEMLRRLIGENLELVWVPHPEPCRVKMDPAQLDQILTNLSLNARDAVGYHGTVRIGTARAVFDQAFCAAHPGARPGTYVLLSVADDGKGMDRETLDRVFEPFFTTKEMGRGTGLGLATVYGIVKQNGGFIDVESRVGEGSTFRVFLPWHEGAGDRPDDDVGFRPPPPPGSETILVVEDDPGILGIASTMLGRMGYTVLTASSPGEALRMAEARTGDIHLLLTDVIMPEMNGRDLARSLLSLHPGMKRIFMSGYTADIVAPHGVLDPGVHFLHKPFSREDLARAVSEALRDEPPEA